MERTALGIELGSTRIKAIRINSHFETVSTGGYTWKSSFENGVWTYSLAEAWVGLKAALAEISDRDSVAVAGISGMMHGYLAFDSDWNLLVPFRTWQNTITGEAAEELSRQFHFNVPQRWNIAHFYQAILNHEEHVSQVAHITTLAGYIHHELTGENVVGVGEASGIFPIDSSTNDYVEKMIETFDRIAEAKGITRSLREILPRVLVAGENAGVLTEAGSAKIDGMLPVGLPFAPPEGDAGTGMVATNAVSPRTGNVSAGTSIFSMVVLERPLQKVYPEIDLVTTPSGHPVAMVHCNNCTSDMNAWVGVFQEIAQLCGADVTQAELFPRLYNKSLAGEADCGGITVWNYLAGEGVTHIDEGHPMVMRSAGSRFTLANFLRAQLYATMATLRIGMDILGEEGVDIDSLTGHGGLFKTPVVGQRYMAAACNTAITCMETAGEGGAYGMALLAAYMLEKDQTLEQFLSTQVFAAAKAVTVAPDPDDVAGFAQYLRRFEDGIALQAQAANLTI